MRGPAIRYWELSKVLSQYFDVTLAVPPFAQANSCPEELSPSFKVRLCKTKSELETLARNTEVIVTLGANLTIYPFLTKLAKPLIVDMYIPFMLEDLYKYKERSLEDQFLPFAGNRGSHTLQIRAADFIICASEKQKDFWLGWLAALGRINPYTYRDDPTLMNLITVLPFGLPGQPPVHQKRVLKGVYQGIEAEDKIILWGGGLWNWLDPYTLIKAVGLIAANNPQVKLFFMGIRDPHSASAYTEAAQEAMTLSRDLGLYNKQIFFNEWVSYTERANYLLEADLGASLHLDHIETRFSFRTRLLDYIWAGLPILTTEGDTLSEEITKFQLGKVARIGDIEQVSQFLLELLNQPDFRQSHQSNFDQVRSRYQWEIIARPLIEFCKKPRQAADKPYLAQLPPAAPLSFWGSLPLKITSIIKTYGPKGFLSKAHEYIQWKLQK